MDDQTEGALRSRHLESRALAADPLRTERPHPRRVSSSTRRSSSSGEERGTPWAGWCIVRRAASSIVRPKPGGLVRPHCRRLWIHIRTVIRRCWLLTLAPLSKWSRFLRRALEVGWVIADEDVYE